MTDDSSFRLRKRRSEDEIRDALKLVTHIVWHREPPPGAHVWSIPADPERDFDCILYDAFAELTEARRVLKETLAALTARWDPNIGATLVAHIKRVLGESA